MKTTYCPALGISIDIDLRGTPKGKELSICGNIKTREIESCGQNIGEIARLLPDNPRVQRIHALWKRWHLNSMKGGTFKQEACLSQMDVKPYPSSYYDQACAYLKEHGLYDDGGYRYGQEWLHEQLPECVVAEIQALQNKF